MAASQLLLNYSEKRSILRISFSSHTLLSASFLPFLHFLKIISDFCCCRDHENNISFRARSDLMRNTRPSLEPFSEIPSPLPAGTGQYHADQKETAGTISEPAAETD
jgi:hypothetical protein